MRLIMDASVSPSRQDAPFVLGSVVRATGGVAHEAQIVPPRARRGTHVARAQPCLCVPGTNLVEAK